MFHCGKSHTTVFFFVEKGIRKRGWDQEEGDFKKKKNKRAEGMRVTEKKKKLVETLAVKWKPQCHCDYLKKKKKERERERTYGLFAALHCPACFRASSLLVAFLFFFFFGS